MNMLLIAMNILHIFQVRSMQTLTSEFQESTSWTVQEWKSSGGSLITSKLTCTEPAYGPYYGKISTNVHKDYSNLAPHYGIIMSIDILLTGYWVPSNYVRVQLDSSTVYSQTNQDTSDFVLSYTYCENNQQFLTLAKQKLVTGLVDLVHVSSNLRVDLQCTFGCSLLSLFSACERFAECHQTCLTCNGPLQTDCLTCPQGIPTLGQCACSTGVSYQNACITSCPQYYIASSNQCIIECSLNCQSCGAQSKCVNCESGYFPVNGQCYSVCPSHASMVNSVCKDYVDQSTYGSTYVAKHFYSDSENIKELSDKFTFTATSSNSILTQQKYSRYNNQFMLGGFGVWSDGSFSISYSGLSPHNQIRLYLTTQVENWSGAQFSIQADTVQIYTQSTLTGTQQVSTQFAHNANTLTIKLISTLSGSSYSGNIAIYKIFIISDQCDQGCITCGLAACQQCSAPYTLIMNKCIKCGDAYNRNSDCSCKTGYYDNNQLSCSACLTACQTCSNGIECTSCNTSSKLTNLPNCDKCVDGYYMELGVCKKCINRCSTCTSANICISCDSVGKFINPPACDSCVAGYDYESSQCVPQCQSGYFKNEFKVCTTCAISCAQCIGKSDNCTECAANRVGWPQCNCPTGGYSRLSYFNSWCTTCETGVPYAWFADDLNSIIVDFGGDLKSDLSLNCAMLLQEATLLKFGKNPKCIIQTKYIVLYLGQNSTILVGNSLLLNKALVQLANCKTPFLEIKSVMVNYPIQRLQPKIHFSHYKIQTTPCKSVYIDIIAQEVNGQRDLQLISWQGGNNLTTKLISLWNKQLDSKQFIIQAYDLPTDAEYIFSLSYTNCIGQGSQQSITIQVNDKITANVQYPSGPLYSKDAIVVLIKPELSPCSNKNRILQDETALMNATFLIKQVLGNGYQQQLVQEVYFDQFHEIHIEQYTLQPNYYYDITISLAQVDKVNLVYKEQFTIFVQLEDLECTFANGNRSISYTQQIDLEMRIYDPNTIEQNFTGLQYKWSCTNLIKSEFCRDINNNLISFNDSLTQKIRPKSFEPYTLLQIIFQVNQQQTTAVIYIIENYIPSLTIEQGLGTSTKNNLYDYLKLQFVYQDQTNPDDLLYVGQLYYQYDLIGYFTFHYLQLKFQLWNYIQENDIEEIRLKVNIYNPNYIMPSSTQLIININQPPNSCTIENDKVIIQSLREIVTVKVQGCIDKNKPLKYQFILYHSLVEFNLDNSIGTINQGYIIKDFSYESQYQGQLTGNDGSILMVRVKDSLDGIANITSVLKFNRVPLGQSQQLEILNTNNYNDTRLRNSMLLLIDCKNYNETQLSQMSISQIQLLIQEMSDCCYQEYSYKINKINTLLSPFIVLTQSEINNQLKTINQHINELNTNQIEPLAEFEIYQQQQQWYIYADQLSSAYKQMQHPQNRRLLQTDDSESRTLLMSGVTNLAHQIMSTQIINQSPRNIETNEFTMETAKVTTKQLQSMVGPILQDMHYVGKEQQQESLSGNAYDYRLLTYNVNPFQNDSAFQQISSGENSEKLFSPNITQSNQTKQITLNQPLQFNFNKMGNNLDEQYSCVSQIAEAWDFKACSLDGTKGSAICSCQMVTMVTLVLAFEDITDKVGDFFSFNTLTEISTCLYYDMVFTYILGVITLLYIIFMCYSDKLDKRSIGQPMLTSKIFPMPLSEKNATSKPSKEGVDIKLSGGQPRSPPNEDRLNIPSKKDMFSFKRIPHLSFHTIAINNDKDEIKRIKDNGDMLSSQRSAKNEAISPNSNLSQRPSPHQPRNSNILGAIKDGTFTKSAGFIVFLKNFHPILSLYYRYDYETSRQYRSTLIYVILLGQISILVFFGKTLDINTVIALSIISSIFGAIFQIMIMCLAKNRNLYINWFCANVIVGSTCLFIFIIIGSIAKYENSTIANLWALSYICSFIIDYCVYRTLISLLKFYLLQRFAENENIKNILLRLMEKEVKEIFYGIQESQHLQKQEQEYE